MSLIRDTRYIASLSKMTGGQDVMPDASRMILSEVELKLRNLIVVKTPNFNFSRSP